MDRVHSGAESASIPAKPALVPVTPGQWIVTKGQFRHEVSFVKKVSDKRVTTGLYGGEGYRQPDSVMFAGTEEEARRLLDVIVSLEARLHQAKNQLNAQHRERVAKAVEKATENLSTHAVGISEGNEPNPIPLREASKGQ